MELVAEFMGGWEVVVEGKSTWITIILHTHERLNPIICRYDY